MLAQWGMGFWHHRVYKQTKLPTRFGIVHRYFVHIIIFLTMVNGGIGLTWSSASKSVGIEYSIAVVIIGLGLVVIVGWSRWVSRHSQQGFTSAPVNLGGPTGNDSHDCLNQHPDIPTYNPYGQL